jgi:hypothetical protein
MISNNSFSRKSKNEYDDLIEDMCDIEDKISTELKNEKITPIGKEEKLDLILSELKDLKRHVGQLQEVVQLQSIQLEAIDTSVRETKQIAYGTYKKLNDSNNNTFYNTISELASPLLGSIGLGAPVALITNANKVSNLSYKLYKMWI